MAERQAVKVTIDGQELEVAHVLEWTTTRKDILPGVALGVANNTGLVTLRINGHAIVHLHLHEDQAGYVVVDAIDPRTDQLEHRFDVELYGYVAPRMGAKLRGAR